MALRGGPWLRCASVALVLGGACARGDRIVVGSKNFTQSHLLGELVAQQIARRTGLAVERRFHPGGTFVCHQAVTAGPDRLLLGDNGTADTPGVERPPHPA